MKIQGFFHDCNRIQGARRQELRGLCDDLRKHFRALDRFRAYVEGKAAKVGFELEMAEDALRRLEGKHE